MNAKKGYISTKFTFFRKKNAPVSKKISCLNYEVKLEVNNNEFITTVWVPVTTLCPCSKAISKYSAHNQRSIVKISVTTDDNIDFEGLINIAEEQASCELFGIIKREDEKYVTEKAYENPKFVEDIVRDIAIEIKKIIKF